VVRGRAHHADEGRILPVITNADSGAFRCLPPIQTSWTQLFDEKTTCTGLTAIDPPGATWNVTVFGSGSFEPGIGIAGFYLTGEFEPGVAETVEIELLEEAPGGLASEVDTSKLSMPTHDVGETETHRVESHDGNMLNVELTKPADAENVPTILVSTPYAYYDRVGGNDAYEEVVQEYVPRGYAVAIADVRGFGQSQGCVEVWGPDERADQAELVEWITEQDFSDGKVGMMGVSYPGTTPVEAAVEDPDGLEAIVTVAGVIDAYRDWHFGGVPNGENTGSPVFYQELGTRTSTGPTEDPVKYARERGNGVCDPTLAVRANDPRTVYDEYYEVRNFSTMSDQVDVPVMVEHAYEDPNVKSSLQLGFFDELDVPKLGIFGHWSHQNAARADEPLLRLAWMDEFVKDKDLGLENVSKASITANGDRHRVTDNWPAPTDSEEWFPNFDQSTIEAKPSEGDATIRFTPTQQTQSLLASTPAGQTSIVLETTLMEPLRVAGQGTIHLSATLEGADNAHVAAGVYDATDEDAELVTFGASNLAHRNGHKSYEPVQPGQRVSADLPLQPTEYVFEPGDTLRVVFTTVSGSTFNPMGTQPAGELTLHGGEDGTTFDLPTVGEDAYSAIPAGVGPQMLTN
jgi:predicted acyl esterase